MRSIMIVAVIVFCMKTLQSYVSVEEKMAVKRIANSHLEYMESIGIQCPEVVVAQLCLETRYLTSRIYKENHNLFGMKESSKDTFCIGTQHGHALYPSDAHSLLAYRDWQRRRFPNRKFESNEEYIYALGHLFKRHDGSWARYAEDLDYEKKIKKIINILYNE